MFTHLRCSRRRALVLTATATVAAVLAGAIGAAPAYAAVPAPTDLRTAGRACAAEAPGPYLSPGLLNDARAVVLRGTISGADDGAELQADFQVWDVADPEHPQQWLRDVGEDNDEAYVQLEDESKQLDGVTYGWRVRVLDGAAASPWSATCHFTVDRTAGEQPVVESPDYPAGDWEHAHGAIGTPGAFTVTPRATDIVRYRYRLYAAESSDNEDWVEVPADGLGGTATIAFTPQVAGYHSLAVQAVDRAGNVTQDARHEFYVTETRPSVFSAAYRDFAPDLDYNVGVPGAFEFTSTVADTVSFAWRIDGGPAGSAPVSAEDPRRATAMIAPDRPGRQTLHVASVTRDGTTHAARAYEFLVDNGPALTGDTDRAVTIGSSLRYHLAPRMPAVREYEYVLFSYDVGESTPQRIPARADGTADLTWTATRTDVAGIRFRSRGTDGTLSETRYSSILVDDARPWVTRTGGEQVGTPATFTARSEMANIVDFIAWPNNDENATIVTRPAANGVATFRYTPTTGGHTWLNVVARNAAGVRSGVGGVSWTVDDSPRITSTDFPTTGQGPLATGSFTFTPRTPGTTAYLYSMDWGPYTTLAARPDGTATLTWTPDETGAHRLEVQSRMADGTRSWTTIYEFTVGRDTLAVRSVAPSSLLAGGVRVLTVRGAALHPRDTVQVTPAGRAPLTARVKSLSADHTALTVEVNLTSAPPGRAGVTVRPYGSDRAPVVLSNALTITAPALRATKKPAVTGTVAVGNTVRANTGTWTPAATSFTYRWAANGATIKGATGPAYPVTASVLGKRLTVTVTAARAGHPSGTAVSAATAPVARGKAPTATRKPAITGTATVGRTVKATAGAWSPKAGSYRYEWRTNGSVVRGATRSSLKLTPSMRGKRLTVTVTALKVGYANGRAVSATVTVRR